ncbi:MAG: hypothetical protein ABIK83_12190 [Candidatus Zixiibacteriota bacterium]
MSKDDRDRLEIEINKYLDGETSDGDFEKFLKGRPEDFDVDSFRSLKTRVEKIEELYRQLEEPSVPDGYWETFADRVVEKLGAKETSSVWEKILGILLPTRWPKMAFGYAGALASVLLVFVIGKAIMESGADTYSPASYQTPVVEDKSAEHPAKDEVEISDDAEPKRVELPKSASRLEPVGVGNVEIDREKKSGIDEFTVDNGQIEAEAPSGVPEGGKGAAEKKATAVPIPEPSEEDVRLATIEIIEGDAEPHDDVVPEMLQMPEPIANDFVPEIVREEPSPIPPIEGEEPSLHELSDITPDISKQSATQFAIKSTSGLSDETDGKGVRETSVWKYDNWNLEDLRIRLKFYEAIVDDSAFSSETFSEYAEIRSSVAILTRDSIDIYDAVNTIDTLLNYNQQIDRPTWMLRREQIRSLRNSMTNP